MRFDQFLWCCLSPGLVSALKGSMVILRPIFNFRSSVSLDTNSNDFNTTIGRVLLIDKSGKGCGGVSDSDIHTALNRSSDLTTRLRGKDGNDANPKSPASNYPQEKKSSMDEDEDDFLGELFASPHLLLQGCLTSEVSGLVQKLMHFHIGAVIFSDLNITKSNLPDITTRHADGKLIPVVSFTDEIVYQITSAIVSNITTVIKIDPHPLFDCEKIRGVFLASSILAVCWLTLCIFWMSFFSPSNAIFLHSFDRLFYVVPGCHSILCIFHRLCWSLCPDFASKAFQFLLLAHIGFAICARTLFIGTILLAAKGWRVVRLTTNGQEAVLVSILVSLVYIVESLGQIDSAVSFPGTLGLHLLLVVEIIRSTNKNLNFLRHRERFASQHPAITNFLSESKLKRKLLTTVLVSSVGYFVLDGFARVFLGQVLGYYSLAWIFTACLEFSLWLVISVVYYITYNRMTITFDADDINESDDTVLPMYKMNGTPIDISSSNLTKEIDVPIFLIVPPYQSLDNIQIAMRVSERKERETPRETQRETQRPALEETNDAGMVEFQEISRPFLNQTE